MHYVLLSFIKKLEGGDMSFMQDLFGCLKKHAMKNIFAKNSHYIKYDTKQNSQIQSVI